MKLKRVLDTLDGLDEGLAKLYEERNGKFHLMTDDPASDDSKKLKQLQTEIESLKARHSEVQEKNERLSTEMKKHSDAVKDAERKAQEEEANAARERADKEAGAKATRELEDKLTAKFEAEVAAIKQGYETKIEELSAGSAKLKAHLEEQTSGNAARQLATEMARKPEHVDLLLPFIERRLAPEIGDKVGVTVLDDERNPVPGKTVEDLKVEMEAMLRFADIIKGSSASGGQNSNDGQVVRNGGKQSGGQVNRADFLKMNPQQQQDYLKDNSIAKD